jgi:2-deoxy-D-gluconate 3-dehydrogenase
MPVPSLTLDDKVALVTGAGTGIGQAIAAGYASVGAKVVCHYRQHIKQTSRTLDHIGADYITIQSDFAKAGKEELAGLLQKAIDGFGQLDILVNCAGTIRKASAIEHTEEDWDTVLNVNLKAPFFLCQGLARYLLTQGKRGKIINIASIWSFQGSKEVASYTASKSALAGVTKTLANEWASKGINVNAIAPGFIMTENTRTLWSDEKTNSWLISRIPSRRWGHPRDIVGMAIYLASPASDYVNGAVLPVDGGWLGM